jgi:hypothetical protein
MREVKIHDLGCGTTRARDVELKVEMNRKCVT